MALQFTPWVVPLTFAFLVTVVLAGYGALSYRRHPDQTHLLAFAVFLFAVSGWSALTAGGELTTSHSLKHLFANVANVLFVPGTLYGGLWFALTYTGNERWVNRWTVGVAVVHPLASAVLVTLFPNVLYETWVATEPGMTLLGVTFAPFVVLKRDLTTGFVVLQVYAYAVMLTSGFVVGRFLLRHRESLYRGQAIALLAGILVPVATNALLFTGAVPADYNLTELSFVVSGSAFAFGIFRYQLFDLVPVARDVVIEDMREGFVVCNDRNAVLDSNPAARDILGADGETLTGRNVCELFPGIEPLLRSPDEEATREISLDAGETDQFLAVSVSPLGNDGGNGGRLVTFRDVTERHWYERELEEEREKYSTLVEQSHDGVAIIQDGVVVFVNQQVERLIGQDEPDLLGSPFQTFVSPEDRDMVVDRYEQRLRGERVSSRYDVELATAGGDRRVADLQATDIQYGGEPAVLVTLNDITERKAYERDLEEQNHKLELLNRLVRHDIRNDMNVVIGYAQRLDAELEPTQASDAVEESLDTLLSRSRHVVELTDIVRDLMRTMQSGGTQLEPVSLRAVLDAELDDLRSSETDAVVRGPAPVPDVSVLADDMLGSVLWNVLTNAVKHNDRATPEVDVSVSETDDHVAIRVADDGPGVEDSRKEEIFGKGERGLESTGTGIGLYLVHTLVTSYGGEVWVEDNVPRGSVFTIELARAERDTHS